MNIKEKLKTMTYELWVAIVLFVIGVGEMLVNGAIELSTFMLLIAFVTFHRLRLIEQRLDKDNKSK